MARLSKGNLGDRGRFQFKQEEVDLPQIGGSVLVRSPSVAQRNDLATKLPGENEDWSIEQTAMLFSIIVVDPDVTPEEAAEFLGDWPGDALDTIINKFGELIGNKEELREAAGDFRGSDDGSEGN